MTPELDRSPSTFPDPVELAALGADRHWYGDGLPGLLRGILLLIIASLLSVAPRDPFHPYSTFFPVAFMVCLFFLSAGDRWILEPLKARLTYPRAGYSPAPPAPIFEDPGFFWPPISRMKEIEAFNRRETISSWAWNACMVFFFVSKLVVSAEWRWRLPLTFVPLAAILWFERPRPNASILAPLACIVAGLTARLASVPERQEVRIFCLILGGFYFLQGVYQLVIFLRLYPRIRGENAPLS